MIDKTNIPLEELEEEDGPEEADIRRKWEEDGIKKAPDDKVVNIEKAKKEKELKAVKMSEVENKFNFSEMESYLDTRLEGFISDMTVELEKQQSRVLNFVEKKYSEYLNKPLALAKDIMIQTAPIKRTFKGYIDDIYQKMYIEFESGVEGQSNFKESNFIGFRVNLIGDKFANDLQSELQYVASDNMTNKLALSQILDNIKALFRRFISGRIVTAGRTEGSFSLNKSLDDVVKENKRKIKKGLIPVGQEIKRFQYSAIMDSKTTELCQGLNGMVVDDGSAVMSQYSPPLHYNCRSVWTPVTQEEIDNPRVAGTDISTDKSGKPYTVNTIAVKVGKKGLEQKQF